MLQHILPVRDGPVEVVELVLQDISNPTDQTQLLLPSRSVAEVVLQQLDQLGLVVRLLEDGFQAHKCVPVAR